MSNLSLTVHQILEESGLLSLFARKQFTSQLLERSFNSTSGWLELTLVIVIMAVTFGLSTYLTKKYPFSKTGKWGFLHHVVLRILWPLMMLVISVIALSSWNLAGNDAMWLQLLAMAARWMILIRIAVAIVHAALPNNKMTDSLERFLSGALWLAFVLWVSGVDDILIRDMKSVELPIGSTTLNLYTMLTGLLWVAVIIVIALWIGRFIDDKLMSTTRLDINLRIVLSKIIKAFMIVLSVLIALPLVGIDLTVLSVFGGAVGVGIGFGLQKVASNYISGFIILGDRSIRPGDRLTVDNFTGYVTKITSRFVVLKSLTGSEALIPNETFVTSTVINESYSSKSLWQSLDVQVAYATDLTQAMQILEECAAAQDRVDTSPVPRALVLGFGDNGIDLRVGFWVKDPENGFALLFSNILFAIWQRFNEEGIEFPFPQREVRILNEYQALDGSANIQVPQPMQSDNH
ncbi:mechanosensitive ion channel family protein [Neisseria montereyensis]|uniref:Mechanosensitive ion channel n=1 Tax=Neisseria montereyensis TaxID=2973938 RepID=A0ABT2FCT8_9NEIS|nr:mechanosensitive ion channel domain-containing protein [Neisseria montereyensis]MCS4533765.1 mechanosensitive ion channel [Neisseria montereyensis]